MALSLGAYLDDGLRAGHFEHLTGSFRSIGQCKLNDLGELRELDIAQNDQRSVHTSHRLVR
jgi:hypothetical protein